MRILTAEQVRQWDQFTIANEPIPSIALMERAALACTAWIEDHTGGLKKHFAVFCGKGNNGGDGLAIARMLALHGHRVSVHILEFGHKGTEDFQVNLERLHQVSAVDIRYIQSDEHFPHFQMPVILVDAIFGTGLNRAPQDVTERLLKHLNDSGQPVIAIDLPTGMFADRSSKESTVIRAHHTLSFQCYKPALLYAENAPFFGEVHIIDIGLLESFETVSRLNWLDARMAAALYQPRNAFTHKGNFGHALLLAGSEGKIGAAVLAARACLAGGTGLLTACVPAIGYEIIQSAVPEAMAVISGKEDLEPFPGTFEKFRALGAGPGMGTGAGPSHCLEDLVKRFGKPMVLDADALNILSAHPALLEQLTPFSVLTPHPREFERLFGPVENDFERTETAARKAADLQLIIILKGHHTLIAMPGGQLYFNSSGNAGMAKGGSGDVLTGFITGMLSSGYTAEAASLLGVYLHGLAGDIAAAGHSMETMTASDIVTALPLAFRSLADDATAEHTGF